MEAQGKRPIAAGHGYTSLFPKSTGKDSVVVGGGKACLEDTLKLIQQMVPETLEDTRRIAPRLQGDNLRETCRNIWNFVYGHIQYTMDKTGIEQVRRPARSWADRHHGVDCDCYSVFIGGILSNLGIPYKLRVTKYGGKAHFQHIYPIVPTGNTHITMDCVTDRFDHEVPFSEKKDITVPKTTDTNTMEGLSGVDFSDIALDALEQRPVPLHTIQPSLQKDVYCRPFMPGIIQKSPKKTNVARPGLSPYRLEEHAPRGKPRKGSFNLLHLLAIATISVGAGIGAWQLAAKMARPKKKTKKGKKQPIQKTD